MLSCYDTTIVSKEFMHHVGHQIELRRLVDYGLTGRHASCAELDPCFLSSQHNQDIKRSPLTETSRPTHNRIALYGIRGAALSSGDTPLLYVNLGGSAREGICIRESSIFPGLVEHQQIALRPPNLQKEEAIELDSPAILPAIDAANAPYHWLHDCLPRILAFEQAGLCDLPIIIPKSHAGNAFIKESLKLLGIRNPIVEAGTCPIKAPEFWVTEDLYTCEPVHIALLGTLRDRLLTAASNVHLPTSPPNDRLFIWRAGDKRGLCNEDAARATLNQLDFVVVHMEKLPLAEQILTAQSATVIAGPHGAGLFHTLFMESGCVVELFPHDPIGPQRNGPCWQRILDVHEFEGRSITWLAINSEIKPLHQKHRELFRLVMDCDYFREVLYDRPGGATPNRWSIISEP